ncbi:Protein of unknown function (DUF1538) [Rubrobacter radiotolerans]|uniref:DUF1538 domain-containing protein n=1 Tax=Rubrobacter radiotolerans TaxID=42256 RepID=A0A023X619_RUBRA|nr:Protein of unknown function (DUF1538) [Rubrobacter radiotolerans]SMC06911.1 Protein of unknown function [Rubrobacter radiotolerans DSM 5868]
MQEVLGIALRLIAFLGEGLRSVAPVIGILLVFQLLVLRQPLENWREIAFGLVLTVVGLVVFLRGLEIGLTPLGESASNALAGRGSLSLVVVFGVALGYGATLAEPALRILAEQVENLTAGALGSTLFVQTVAVGVALGLAVGAARIVLGVETTPFFIPALALALVLTFFAPERYTGLAFDAALATTGPVTVPLAIALGSGLALALDRGDVLIFGFGLVAFAALGPILCVLALGIYLGSPSGG